MNTLLSAAQLSSIRVLGERGMISDVTLQKETEDLGNDLTDDPYGSKVTYSTVATVKGWLVGRWQTDRSIDIGDVNSSSIYRLRLSVGTEVHPGWNAVIGGNTYLVVDVGVDQTWPEWLNVMIRRAT